MTRHELTVWRRANGITFGKQLPDGRLVGVTRQLFTVLVWIGDTEGWHEGWEYPTLPQALAAAVYFVGERPPMDGWVRHIHASRTERRQPPEEETR